MQGGFGLFSIRERLEMIGGSFDLDAAPGRGTQVTLTAPARDNPAETPEA
jgi:signal transduction histidine kinase